MVCSVSGVMAAGCALGVWNSWCHQEGKGHFRSWWVGTEAGFHLYLAEWSQICGDLKAGKLAFPYTGMSCSSFRRMEWLLGCVHHPPLWWLFPWWTVICLSMRIPRHKWVVWISLRLPLGKLHFNKVHFVIFVHVLHFLLEMHQGFPFCFSKYIVSTLAWLCTLGSSATSDVRKSFLFASMGTGLDQSWPFLRGPSRGFSLHSIVGSLACCSHPALFVGFN